MKISEPDSAVDKSARALVIRVKNDNHLELFSSHDGKDLFTISLMKDVFMVLRDNSRMRVGDHDIIDTALYDTCLRINVDSLPDEYRKEVIEVISACADSDTLLLRSGLELEGYKDILYISSPKMGSAECPP